MFTSARTILNDPSLLAAREAHFARLAAVYAGTAEAPVYLQGTEARCDVDPYTEPERWVRESLAWLATQADRVRDAQVFRPLCLEFGPYGVHFVDRILGARVYQQKGQWWADYVVTPIGDLAPPDLERDETWALARQVAAAFVSERVSVPLFGLPTIASALNVAVNLYGPAFLEAMALRPEAAEHDLRVINALLITLHRWYQEHIPRAQLQPVVAAYRCQPPGYGQLCGCTTHLISAEPYRDMVAPLDAALLGAYPRGGMIHLCGEHRQHLATWRNMPALRAVQLNDRAAEDLEACVRGLREDQVIYLNPTETMTAARALEITGGRRLVLVAEP